MHEIKNADGSWVKAETVKGVLTYTDSDGVWMKETYNKKEPVPFIGWIDKEDDKDQVNV
jgi:hypothetical protein